MPHSLTPFRPQAIRMCCALLVAVAFAVNPAHAQKGRKPAKPRTTKPAPRTTRPNWIKELSPGMLRDYSNTPPPPPMIDNVVPYDDGDGKESPKEGSDGKPIKTPTKLPSKQALWLTPSQRQTVA